MSITKSIISQPAAVSLSRNPVVFRFSATGDDGETNIRVHISLAMFVGGATTGVESSSLSALVDDNGEVEFDVSSLLQHADNYAFTYPDVAIEATVHPELGSYFKLLWHVSYGDGETTFPVLSDEYYYLNAGISADDEAYLASQDLDWWTFFSDSQLWLNFMPGAKRTILQAPERLYWYAFRTATEALKIYWTASDGSTGIITKSVDMVEHSIYEVTVSPALVEAAMGGKTLVSYFVEIDKHLGRKEFVMNTLSYHNQVFFLFQNQMGVWETLWCKGQLSETHEYDKTAVQIKPTDQLNPLAHQNSYIQNELFQTGEISTGILGGNEWVLWASDILSGAPVYLCDGERLFPIKVDTNSTMVKQVPNYEFLYFKVQYTYSKKTNFPNRLLEHKHNIVIMTAENGDIITDEEGHSIVYE